MLEAKFFELFYILHCVKKQVYKLKLYNKQKIYDIFHVLLLKQDITKKRQVDENIIQLKFEIGNNKKYEVKIIWDNAVYAKKLNNNLSGLYYLIL